jgi:hypothetical protein
MARFDRRARETTAAGLRLLREGRFFAAHECFEEAWRRAGEAGGSAPEQNIDQERTFMHALAQLAASYHQLTLGRARASVRTWLKARDKLVTLGALSSDYQLTVEAFWARLALTAEAPRSIRLEDLPARETWPCPEYLLAFVNA